MEQHNETGEDFLLTRDDDNHWYVVPASKYDEFERWVNHNSYTYRDGFTPWDGFNFDLCRVQSPHKIRFQKWREL